MLVGYTSSVVIIFQAAQSVGASPEQISSWLWALGAGTAATSIGLSLFYRTPIATAWSTPGAALLAVSMSGASIHDAIGVFLFSSSLIVVFGVTGWFDKLMRYIPMSLAGAMLAGVLLRFSLGAFQALEDNGVLVGAMVLVYLVCKRLLPRYAIPCVLLAGIGVASAQGALPFQDIHWELATPVWVSPSFSWSSIIGVGLPLFVVTMASQNMPGMAVLRANGYQTPISPLISWTGITGLILAPFGGISFNLAAITAAICMGKEAGDNPKTRYFASVWAGIFYFSVSLFAATIASLFAAFPSALIITIAGLALLGTIGSSLASALQHEDEREAALLAFLVTASGVTLAGIGSAFWGVAIGLVAYHLFKQPHSR